MPGQNLQARPKILEKISEHQINQSKRKFSQKKICLVPQMCTGAKNSYGGFLFFIFLKSPL
jgi:hypothetical protein